MNGEGIDIFSANIRAGNGTDNRRLRNKARAELLRKQGYTIEESSHPNGAFFAYIGKTHKPHELEVGRICAENGFAFTLDEEGKAKIRMPNRTTIFLASPDGTIEGVTQEIKALNGKPSASAVAEGIQHSYKLTKGTPSTFAMQAKVAITFTPKGSSYTRQIIDEGVEEYKRRYEANETKANPRIYLHVDEERRKVWYRRLK